ncbi:MAG: archaeosine synthase subunit alpha [Candidatus Thermoplasmatota archaeon]
MQYRIINRDGPGRIGQIHTEKNDISTPNLIYPENQRFIKNFKPELYIKQKNKDKQEILIKKYKENIFQYQQQTIYPMSLPTEIHLKNIQNNDDIKTNSCILPGNIEAVEKTIDEKPEAEIYTVYNAKQLYKRSKLFINYITKVREKIGYQKILYLPAVATPQNIPFLTYIGIDLFDSLQAIIAARKQKIFLPNIIEKLEKIQKIPCSCPICTKKEQNPEKMKFEDLLQHNYQVLENTVTNTINQIKKNNLLNYVENNSTINPKLTTDLRNIYKKNSFLEKRTPIYNKQTINANTIESLNRSDIKRFRNRIIKRYEKPTHTKILLILPCSAKKPYSFSKSHHFFRKQINSTDNPYIIHELIITSPLGLVPRELELTYPASSYDIPVTGTWYEEEKNMVKKQLEEYLNKNQYQDVIIHIPDEIRFFIEDYFKNSEITCKDHPTSDKSLKNLSSVLKEKTSRYKKVEKNVWKKEKMFGLAKYQFGKKIAEDLLENTYITGRYPYLRIIEDEQQIGMISEKGLIALTLEGGKKIFDNGKFWVEIEKGFRLKGSVLAPGVLKADEDIRIEDEVLIVRDQKLIGVGIAGMNGFEMNQLDYGEAVKVRHKK